MKKAFPCLLALVAMITPVLAEAPRITFSGIDTSADLETNLDALNNVMSGSSPLFETIWSGTSVDDVRVMLGVNAGKIELITATIDGSFEANDRADIVAIEKAFGLDGYTRTIGECGSAISDASLSCAAVFYACPAAPPTCYITILSFGSQDGSGRTTIAWRETAADITGN